MTVLFLDPGGDATYNVNANTGFYDAITGAPAIATDFVNTYHVNSIRFRPANLDSINIFQSIVTAGSRWGYWIYIAALPTTAKAVISDMKTVVPANNLNLYLTTGGALQLWDRATSQLGSDSATLSVGQWYRVCFTYTITSTTVNRFEVYLQNQAGVKLTGISVTNATINSTDVSNGLRIGNLSNNAAMDLRISDIYIDDSTSLVDYGNMYVTNKRPISNGTTNGFTTQIGSGGSGVGTGHAPQVNERPVSTTNGWSMVGAGAAVTEEYNVEGRSAGIVDITNSTIVGHLGWVTVSSLAAETITIITTGTTTTHSTSNTAFTYYATKSTTSYPLGVGTDIGIVTDTSLTTVSLYEAGVCIGFIPNPTSPLSVALPRNR